MWFRVTVFPCNAVAAICDGFVSWIPVTFCGLGFFSLSKNMWINSSVSNANHSVTLMYPWSGLFLKMSCLSLGSYSFLWPYKTLDWTSSWWCFLWRNDSCVCLSKHSLPKNKLRILKTKQHHPPLKSQQNSQPTNKKTDRGVYIDVLGFLYCMS